MANDCNIPPILAITPLSKTTFTQKILKSKYSKIEVNTCEI